MGMVGKMKTILLCLGFSLTLLKRKLKNLSPTQKQRHLHVVLVILGMKNIVFWNKAILYIDNYKLWNTVESLKEYLIKSWILQYIVSMLLKCYRWSVSIIKHRSQFYHVVTMRASGSKGVINNLTVDRFGYVKF